MPDGCGEHCADRRVPVIGGSGAGGVCNQPGPIQFAWPGPLNGWNCGVGDPATEDERRNDEDRPVRLAPCNRRGRSLSIDNLPSMICD